MRAHTLPPPSNPCATLPSASSNNTPCDYVAAGQLKEYMGSGGLSVCLTCTRRLVQGKQPLSSQWSLIRLLGRTEMFLSTAIISLLEHQQRPRCCSCLCLVFGIACDVSILNDKRSDIRHSTKTPWRFQRFLTSLVLLRSTRCWRRPLARAVGVSGTSTSSFLKSKRATGREVLKWSC